MNQEQKFTVILIPLDEGGYQAFFPHYPECISDGLTVEEALTHAKKALTFHLEGEARDGGDPVPHYVHPSHVVVGEVDVPVPELLLEAAH